MPDQYRNFAPGQPLPATWTDALEQTLGNYVSPNFALDKGSSTTVRVVAGTNEATRVIMVRGKPRWITGTITATHPGGAAGTYDIYAITTADAFHTVTGPPPAEIDDTNHAFALKITATGVTPSGSGAEAVYVKIGTLGWDGSAITSVDPLTGVLSDMHQALSALAVSEVGLANQIRAGREYVAADFTTLLGTTAPLAGWHLSDNTDFSGNGRTLTDKGAPAATRGITGATTTAKRYPGTTAVVSYITDASGGPLNPIVGTFTAWVRSLKRATAQTALAKAAGAAVPYLLGCNAAGQATFAVTGYTVGGVPQVVSLAGATDICDGRWHKLTGTWDGGVGRLYVDGQLEGQGQMLGPILQNAGVVNVGGQNGDGSTAVTNPWAGDIDEVVILNSIITPEQERLLYAAKIAHGFATTPSQVAVTVRRRRRGPAWAASDFPATPKRLYNFTAGALTDAGSDGVTLTANATDIPGSFPDAPGPDGSAGTAKLLRTDLGGSHSGFSTTDAGFPTSGARTLGIWAKSSRVAAQGLISYGDPIVSYEGIEIDASGLAKMSNGASSAVFVADGQWHFFVITGDPSDTFSVGRRFYVDGKLVQQATGAAHTVSLGGANRFRIGAVANGTLPLDGLLDGAFVLTTVMTADEIAALYNKATAAFAPTPLDEGAIIEGMDGTYLYVILDSLETQHQVDLLVG